MVSHDRRLIGLVCDTFWRVADGVVEPFAGDLDQYAAWLRTRPAARGVPRQDRGGQSATGFVDCQIAYFSTPSEKVGQLTKAIGCGKACERGGDALDRNWIASLPIRSIMPMAK